MWCTCERKRFPWNNCVGCAYERKHLAGTDCVGCTCDRKQFRRIIVFFSSIVRISVFERSPVAHDLILPSVCARRAYPRLFLGHVGRTPLSRTLTRWWFQMSSQKGVKNRLYSMSLYQCKDGGRAPTLVGPSWLHRPISFAYVFPNIPKPTKASTKTLFHRRNLLYPWDPI